MAKATTSWPSLSKTCVTLLLAASVSVLFVLLLARHGLSESSRAQYGLSAYTGEPSNSTVVCNPRHGEVVKGTCVCKLGWTGPSCSSATCVPPCLNKGVCVDVNICVCPFGWTGNNCQDTYIISQPTPQTLITFFMCTLSAWAAANWLAYNMPWFPFPKISIYMLFGCVCGPYAFQLISFNAMQQLTFINRGCLAFIALAAGHKFYLKGLRGQEWAVLCLTLGLALFAFLAGFLTVFIMRHSINFCEGMSEQQVLAVACLTGALMVARSPASAIAVITELHAAGSFTNLLISVTVLMDVGVLFIFNAAAAYARRIFSVETISEESLLLTLLRQVGLSLLFGGMIGLWVLPILFCSLPHCVADVCYGRATAAGGRRGFCRRWCGCCDCSRGVKRSASLRFGTRMPASPSSRALQAQAQAGPNYESTKSFPSSMDGPAVEDLANDADNTLETGEMDAVTSGVEANGLTSPGLQHASEVEDSEQRMRNETDGFTTATATERSQNSSGGMQQSRSRPRRNSHPSTSLRQERVERRCRRRTRHAAHFVRAVLILAMGWGCMILKAMLPRLIEPLIMLMMAGMTVTNFTTLKQPFRRVVKDVSPAVYACFFTYTGITFNLESLRSGVALALLLFFVRVLGIVAGTLSGGCVAGIPTVQTRIGWLAFITQAGLALGLAHEVKVQYPLWGDHFDSCIIALVLLNQVVGPLGLRYVLKALRQQDMARLLSTPHHNPRAVRSRAVARSEVRNILSKGESLGGLGSGSQSNMIYPSDTEAHEDSPLLGPKAKPGQSPTAGRSAISGRTPPSIGTRGRARSDV
eukprot:g52819.t1